MIKLTANQIHDGNGKVWQNHMLCLTPAHEVIGILPLPQDQSDIQRFDGILCPGFINAHCHLELSHLKGQIDTGTGLLHFLKKVVTLREFPMEEILESIEEQDKAMYNNGIVAVGDISNKTDSFTTKRESNLRYYTFVEMFDFLQNARALEFFNQYKEVYDVAPKSEGHSATAVPHAPYTVSKKLYQLINHLNDQNGQGTVSVHNQETLDENLLFIDRSGGFPEFIESFGFSLKEFYPIGKSSIYHLLANLDSNQKTLFVHNTLSNASELKAAKQWNKQVFFATCPNANLYIENRLPVYQEFIEAEVNVCIGTDSLSSNWKLSVLDEMITILKYQSDVGQDRVIAWATSNGAKALGFDDTLGSFEKGKRPGVNHITTDQQLKIWEKSRVRKIY